MFNSIHATIQIPERIVVNGDTSVILEYPLDQKKFLDSNFMKSFYKPRVEYIGEGLNRITYVYSVSSNCWRGYQGEWEIINDSLFLVDLRPCNGRFFEQNPLEISKLFDSYVPKKGVLANWVFDIIHTDHVSFNNNNFRFAYFVVFGRVVKMVRVRKKCVIFSFQDLVSCCFRFINFEGAF
jgi:hypothetical protein